MTAVAVEATEEVCLITQNCSKCFEYTFGLSISQEFLFLVLSGGGYDDRGGRGGGGGYDRGGY